MEHEFCICGGLNQECDKCAGTGYIPQQKISRPIVAFKIMPSAPPKAYIIEAIKKRLTKKVELLKNRTRIKFLMKINAITEDNKINARDLRSLEKQVDNILTPKSVPTTKTKANAPVIVKAKIKMIHKGKATDNPNSEFNNH